MTRFQVRRRLEDLIYNRDHQRQRAFHSPEKPLALRKLEAEIGQMSLTWWEMDEVNLVAAGLDARSLAAFSCCNRGLRSTLKSPDTLRWLAELRGLDPRCIASVEHIQLAEVMAELSSSIFFPWGSIQVDDGALPSLRKIAKLLARHASLSLSIEAHCGLEARVAMPLPGQARQYTRRRAEAVRQALMREADLAGEALEQERVVTKAWGCSRPLVWAFVDEMYDPSGEHIDPENAGRNRRVELYLRSGSFTVPKRRRLSEIPVEPGKPPMEDRPADELSDDDDASGDTPAEGALAQMVVLHMPDGQQVTVPMAFFQHLQTMYMMSEEGEEDFTNGILPQG